MGEKDLDDEEIQLNNNINNKQRNVVFNRQVEINDTTSRFSLLIAEDVIKHAELYEVKVYDPENPKAATTFDALDQHLVASEQSPKASLNRGLLIDAMKLKRNFEPNEFNNIGIKTLGHWAAQIVLDPKMTNKSIRTEINNLNKATRILENVNSLEAAVDLAMIEDLLTKNPETVRSKVDITNIGQVRTDPQQGMTDNQKLIHNFIADLFMPSDTSLYDGNEGKAETVSNRLCCSTLMP
ncbi:hypothetical protein SAMN02910357_01618 [Succinivibrio dextrinosolvens]|uniref:hypothetical protein n=1 Tax=Succinivibrio dextrinosolvens TaxID=83771 RepID=UPI0008DF24F5|nr:hypothetical protein [Succinivibrio dextrinosolvens]SFS74668.1 hypothetical protein SAMN02910357_01618 [Succinivibrio dextrinosolvens]